MDSTARAAKEYQQGDSGWTSRSRTYKAYRDMPLLPEEEAIGHRKKRKKRRYPKNHIHKYEVYNTSKFGAYGGGYYNLDSYRCECGKKKTTYTKVHPELVKDDD